MALRTLFVSLGFVGLLSGAALAQPTLAVVQAGALPGEQRDILIGVTAMPGGGLVAIQVGPQGFFQFSPSVVEVVTTAPGSANGVFGRNQFSVSDVRVDSIRGIVGFKASRQGGLKNGVVVAIRVRCKREGASALTISVDVLKAQNGSDILKATKFTISQGSIQCRRFSNAAVDNPKIEEFLAPFKLGKRGGIMTYTMHADPRTLNPLTLAETSSEIITERLHASLLESPVTTEPEPAVAEAFEISPDGRTITFTLRRGIKFSDGTPVTTEDVRFTFERLIFPEEVNTRLRDALRVNGQLPKITVVDARTIRFTIPEPFVPFLAAVGQPKILPKHKLKDFDKNPKLFNTAWGVDVGVTNPSEIVGLGPYRLKKLTLGQAVEFERNPFYWKVDPNGTQLPYLDGIRQLIVPERGLDAALENFRNGLTDFLVPRPQDIAVLRRDQLDKKIDINDNIDTEIPRLEHNFWALNWDAPLGRNNKGLALRAVFRNKQFRKAMSLATDRRTIIVNFWLGVATPQFSHVGIPTDFFIGRPNVLPPEDFPNFQPSPFGFDLAAAAKILDDLKLIDTDKDGIRNITDAFLTNAKIDLSKVPPENERELEFTLETNRGNTIREQEVEHIAATLKQIGVSVKTQKIDFVTLVNKILASEYEAVRIGLTGTPDPALAATVYTCEGALHFWHLSCPTDTIETEKRVDQLYDRGARTPDLNARLPIYDEAQRLIADDVWLIHIAVPNVLLAYRTDRIANTGTDPLANDELVFRVDVK